MESVIFQGYIVSNFLYKWAIASFFGPAIVLIFSSFNFVVGAQILVLIIWPGSIMLMSLGAGPNAISTVIYVWSISVTSNLVLYLIVGFVIYLFKSRLVQGN